MQLFKNAEMFYTKIQKTSGPLLLSKWNTNEYIKRNLFNLSRKSKILSNFKRDKVNPSEYQLVYETTMGTYIFGTQSMVCISLVASVVATFMNYQTYWQDTEVLKETVHRLFPYSVEKKIAATFFASVNILMWYVTSSCILRIYYTEKNEEFLIIFPSILPFKTWSTVCKPGQITLAKSVPFIGEHVFNGKRVYLLTEYFKYPYYYNEMLGLMQKDK